MRQLKTLTKKCTAFVLSILLAFMCDAGFSVSAADAAGGADTTAPEITVKEAGEGQKHGDSYCKPPVVTVTDAETSALKIAVETAENKTETEYPGQTVQVPVEGSFVNVSVTATNDAGLSSSVSFTIAHSLSSRQGFTVEATCFEPEKFVGVIPCVYCGEIVSQWSSRQGEASGHTFGQAERLTTEEGVPYEKKVCDICGFEEVTFADMTGHTHSFETVTKNAECAKEGYSYSKCSDCGYVDMDTYRLLEVTGHHMSDYQVVKEPDCGTGTNGYKQQECLYGCGYTRGMDILPQHKWSERRVKKEATCFETGETAFQCELCGQWDESSIETVPRLEHIWEDHDHDCSTPMQCTLCGSTDPVPGKEHALSYHSDASGHWQECENEGCDYRTDTVSHAFPDRDLTDCTGSVTCTVCEYVESGNETHNLEWVITPEGHYAYCKNEGCEYRSEPEEHAGASPNDCEKATVCAKCGYAYIAAKPHSPYGYWSWNEQGHLRHCRNCEQMVVFPHTPEPDDGDCTTPVECSHGACAYIMVPAQAYHDFTGKWQSDADGHYHECENPDCTVTDTAQEHTGGIATCKDQALCEICGNYYGEKNPLNHMGETEVRDYREPTETETGYTGDKYCLDCMEIIERGEEIPEKQHEHSYNDEWVTDGTHHWKECAICGARSNDYATHEFNEWESDETEHFRTCKVCGYTEAVVHVPEEEDYNCETPLKCSICHRDLTEAKTHNFENAPYQAGEHGHYQICQNENCEQISEEQEHTGGTATCVSPAVCELCHTQYGEKDPSSHTGGEYVLGYVDATYDTPGYTGDIYCLGCSQVKSYGQEIPAGEREHDFILEYDEYNHWYACSRCGERKEGSYEEHQYDGSGQCTVCGFNAPFEEHTHKWDGGVVTKEPTCKDPGVRTYTCDECGEHRIEEIPKTDAHSYDAGVVTKEATCGEAGVKTYTCTVCGETKTEEIPKTDAHSYDAGVVTKEATCREAGVKTYTCTVCGATRTEQTEAKGHSWGEWEESSAASVFSPETDTRSCSVCGAVETRQIGDKLSPVLKLNAKKLILQKKQKTRAFRVLAMADGDYVKSVKSLKPKVLKVKKFDKAGSIKLKAKKTGRTKLVIKLASGMTVKVKVRVQKKKVKTTGVKIAQRKTALEKGETFSLVPALKPITTQQKVTFKSADKKIANVSKSGVIKAKKSGKTVVTVRSGAKKIRVKVTVK